jgi:hypothetical protein
VKIKAVAKLVKDAQGLTLINGDERQHISADGAIYPLDGFPLLSEETVFAVLDVPVGERALYNVSQVNAHLFADFLADNQEGDQDATMTDMLVSVNGITLRPIYTPHGLLCVREDDRKPIVDSGKTATYHARMVGGKPVVIVKNGFQLIALLPARMDWAQDNACEWLRDMARQAAKLNNYLHLQDLNDERYSGVAEEANYGSADD